MEFFLAAQLGMTVEALRGALSQEEFVRWQVYYARQAQRRQIADA